ncbi:MAG: hypothetical protein ABFE07_28540 [Armatimonadia bacterium]
MAKRNSTAQRRAFIRQAVLEFMRDHSESNEEAWELTRQVMQMIWQRSPKFDAPIRFIEHMPTGRWCLDIAVRVGQTPNGEGK